MFQLHPPAKLNFISPAVKHVENPILQERGCSTSPQSRLLSVIIERKGASISVFHVEQFINSQRHLGMAFFFPLEAIAKFDR